MRGGASNNLDSFSQIQAAIGHITEGPGHLYPASGRFQIPQGKNRESADYPHYRRLSHASPLAPPAESLVVTGEDEVKEEDHRYPSSRRTRRRVIAIDSSSLSTA